MPIPTSDTPLSDYLLLPVMSVLALAGLVLFLRWTYAPATRPESAKSVDDRPEVGGHGLLVPVTTVRDPAKATQMVAVLAEAGIRATVTGGPREQLLLVWPQQAEAARDQLARALREDR